MQKIPDPANYDTDKPDGYLANYWRWFDHLIGTPASVLELGVQRGGSLKMWADTFPGGRICGLDLNPSSLIDHTGRIRVYQGFQQDPKILDQIRAEAAPGGFDIIIDDASHLGEYTSESFWRLFPLHLKAGGLYVIDDWSCGYWPHWPDGEAYAGPTNSEVLNGGPQADEPPAVSEQLKRKVRTLAGPVSRSLFQYPRLHDVVSKTYTSLQRRTIQRRFPSHEHGMVGFIKQLVDEVAVDVIRADPSEGSAKHSTQLIESIEITPSQALVRKSNSWPKPLLPERS